MRLNQEWQKEWQTIEVPKEAMDQVINKTLNEQEPKINKIQKQPKKTWLIRLQKHPIFSSAISIAVLALLAIGVRQLYMGSPDSSNEMSSTTAQYKQDAEEDLAIEDRSGEQTAVDVTDDKIVQFYTITKETALFQKDTEKIEELVKNKDGYFEQSSVKQATEDSEQMASYKIRIPKEKKAAFLKELKSIGETTEEQIQTENESAVYSDNQSRITALETEERALLALLEKNGSVDEMLKIQDRLSTIRFERETLVRSNQAIDNQVEYITIDLELEESLSKKNADISSVKKIKNNWQKQITLLKWGSIKIAIFVASALPYIIILIISIFVVRYFRKRKMRK